MRASRRAAATEATCGWPPPRPPVLRVLNLVGIDQLIDIHPSVADAVASLPEQARSRRA